MPSPPTTSQALIDEARAALERLAAGAPNGQVAYAAIDDLDRAWPASPLTVGIAGANPTARLAVFDALAGGALVAVTRGDRAPPLRLRRGGRTGFSAAFADGTVERQILPTRPPTAEDEAVQLVRTRAETAMAARDERAAAAAAAAQLLPAVVRTRPPWWAVWAWIARWWTHLFRRRELEARRTTLAALTDADREVARSKNALAAARDVARAPELRYVARLTTLVGGHHDSGGDPGQAVKYVELELADGAVPDDVIVIEIVAAADADDLDRVLEVRAGALFVDGSGGAPHRLGAAATAAPGFGELALAGRAARIGRHAIATIREATRAIEDMLDGTEADYAKRIEPLAAKRLADPDGFVTTQLERIKPQINASIGAIMEHASAHLGGELAKLAAAWADVIGAATSRDQLRDAIAQVDLEWPAATARAGDEARLLIQGGVGGCAHDLHAELVAPLAAYGLPAEHLRPPRAAPELPPLHVLPSLDGASEAKLDTASWLGSLFRSFDTRRADVLAKLTARIAKIREVTRAEMFDAEPKLHGVLAGAAATTLATAIAIQHRWLTDALEREHDQIERDRLQLAPLIAARDAARTDARTLTDMTVALELGESRR